MHVVAPNCGTKSHLGTGGEASVEVGEKKFFFFYNIFQNLERQTDRYIFIGTYVGNKRITGWINEISKDLKQGVTPGATRRRADWTA